MRGVVGRGAVTPVRADAILGVCVAVGLLVAAVVGFGPGAVAGARPVDAGAVALVATVAVAVAVHRRYPVAALVALNAVCLIWFTRGYPERLIALVPLIGCYTLAAQRGWRWGLAGAIPTALIGIVGIRVVLGDTETAGVVPIAVLLAATAGSAGAAVGYYRAVLAVARDQLAQEIHSREERARRLAAEERLRIARELHDVFGHAMATISVQAGVGLHVLEQRPRQAREALAAIKKISDEGLVDVKTILGILRADAPAGQEEPRTPRGGLDRLPELLDTAEAGGLRVELRVEGDPRPLPAAVDLAAYRIIQEALTNVLRHAGARTVRLTVRHASWRLLVRIRDDGPTDSADTSSGHGIEGMRERARALSGRLTAAPHPEGGFEVCAELPIANRDDVPR
jgi:signal transduction histidine kinase